MNVGKAFVYIDNSNVYVEGSRISAVHKKMPGADDIHKAMENRITDHNWTLDYVAFRGVIQTIVGMPLAGKPKLWGSPPPYDPFWQGVEKAGFEVTTYSRKKLPGGRTQEKGIDVDIAFTIGRDVPTIPIDKATDSIFLFAGDGDYVPVVEYLVNEGFQFTCVSWDHAMSNPLKGVAGSHFVSLDQYFGQL